MIVIQRRTEPPAKLWRPLVVAGLLSTLTVGALSGAIDLWSQQVHLTPVPIDHHRGHGLAQVFGFLLLFTMGLSLHLVPRFFGLAEVARGWARAQAWLGISGLVLVVAGRLGALLPGSWWMGPLGALALWVGVTRWLGLVARGALPAMAGGDRLGFFLLAGTGWWWLAASWLLVWSLGQLVTGPLAALPLEPLYAAGLVGGAGSWIGGVMLRAGLCVLRLERPSPARQRASFLGWQLAAAGAVAAGVDASTPALAALGGGLLVAVGALRPWRGALGSLPGEPPQRRMVQAGLAFLGVSAALTLWRASGVAPAALVADAARHSLSLGFVSLTLFGFAGRMVPGFGGSALVQPRLYALGALFVGAGAAVRLLELWPSRALLALSGTSGVLAGLGVAAMTGCLLATLAAGAPVPARTMSGAASLSRP